MIGWEDHLQNDLQCVEREAKLYCVYQLMLYDMFADISQVKFKRYVPYFMHVIIVKSSVTVYILYMSVYIGFLSSCFRDCRQTFAFQRSDSCFYATYRAFINCFSSSSSSELLTMTIITSVVSS